MGAEMAPQIAALKSGDIDLIDQTMPISQYWEKWTEVDLGVTPWTHRPLGTMVPNLAYVADDKGEPVSWNESRWVDPQFSKLLDKASGTLDVDERRKIFCELEDIQNQKNFSTTAADHAAGFDRGFPDHGSITWQRSPQCTGGLCHAGTGSFFSGSARTG
jgi:hypothetical protein